MKSARENGDPYTAIDIESVNMAFPFSKHEQVDSKLICSDLSIQTRKRWKDALEDDMKKVV